MSNITTERKREIVGKYGKAEGDTGSAKVQIAIMTERIRNLTAHLQNNRKDFATRRGLLTLIGKRGRLQNYLKKKNPHEYSELIKSLGLRR